MPTAATTAASQATVARESKSGSPLHEDWVAVWIGAAIILLVIAGIRPAVPRFGWGTPVDLSATVFTSANMSRWLLLGVLLLVPAAIGAHLMRTPVVPFIRRICRVVRSGLVRANSCGILGFECGGPRIRHLCAGHRTGPWTNDAPAPWFAGAIQAEFYIKIGLVILGASVLFSELVEAGLLGIAQALVVVITVWSFSFWLAKRLNIDDELATMLSSAVSICGVSAAIATCGAIQGDRKKLSYVTSLVLVVAVPMMLVMPWVSRVTGMPDAVSGAWLGGTLDTSAAVVAAGELVGEQARNAAVVVKLSQNVLIGVAAFLLTVWWSMRSGGSGSQQVSAGVIWERFPKFVLGFLAVSLVFSFLVPAAAVSDTRPLLNAVRTGWFALAFLSIGLETSFGDLARLGGGRPVVAFLGAQAFNVVVTLIFAYLLFGGLLFPVPSFN